MRHKGHAGEHRDTARATLAVTVLQSYMRSYSHLVCFFCFFSLTLMSLCNFPHKLCMSIKLYMEINTNAKNSTKAKG